MAAIIAEFWRTFFGDPLSNDGWHTLHGIASTSWVLLLIMQSLLIGRGNHRLHRRSGWASLALVTLLVGTSSYIVWIDLVANDGFPRNRRLRLVFLDVTFLLLFVTMYGLGLAYRRNRRLHSRLMGSTILIGLGPALGRLYAQQIPALHGLAGGLKWTFYTIEMILVIAILLELRAKRLRASWSRPECQRLQARLRVDLRAARLGFDWIGHSPHKISYLRPRRTATGQINKRRLSGGVNSDVNVDLWVTPAQYCGRV